MPNSTNTINILEYEGLVRNLVKKIVTNFSDLEQDDLLQAGRLGLLQAAEKYNPDKGAKFSTYAYYYVKAMIKREAEFQLQAKLAESLEKTTYEKGSEPIEKLLEDSKTMSETTITDLEDLFSNKENSHLFDNLSQQEFQVMKMVYGCSDSSSHNLLSIANELGINRYGVKKMLESAKSKMGK